MKIEIGLSITQTTYKTYDASVFTPEDLYQIKNGYLPDFVCDDLEEQMGRGQYTMSNDHTIDIDGATIKDWD